MERIERNMKLKKGLCLLLALTMLATSAISASATTNDAASASEQTDSSVSGNNDSQNDSENTDTDSQNTGENTNTDSQNTGGNENNNAQNTGENGAGDSQGSVQPQTPAPVNYVESLSLPSYSAMIYNVSSGVYLSDEGSEDAVFSFYGIVGAGFDDPMYYDSANPVKVSYPDGKNDLKLSYELGEYNTISFYTEKPGKKAGTEQILVSIRDVNGNTKDFLLTVTIWNLRQKVDSSVLLAKKKSKSLKLQYQTETDGAWRSIAGSATSWASSNKSVAKVSAAGRVTAKSKSKTCYVTGRYGTVTFYWAINVTTNDKVKVIKRAKRIYNTSTYSQPRRMQSGYYDCSSLVWRAYRTVGVYFGVSRSYYNAPVAATEAKYLVSRGKLVKGGIKKSNTTKGKLIAGDLLFRGGANNGRYRGVNHVEMFCGYDISYVKSNGTPVYMNTWASKTDGYYGYGSSADFVCRP